jgi:hypothetical protein
LRNTLSQLVIEDPNSYVIQEEGRIYSYITKFTVLSKDEELTQIPLDKQRSHLKNLSATLDRELMEQAKQTFDTVEEASRATLLFVDSEIRFIKRESANAASQLQEFAEKNYKKIQSLTNTLKAMNIAFEKIANQVMMQIQKVHEQYRYAFQKAKSNDKDEFVRLQQVMATEIKEAEASYSQMATQYLALTRQQQQIENRLKKAKQLYDGSVHVIHATALLREAKSIEKNQELKKTVDKHFASIGNLSRAVTLYGDIILLCAKANADIQESDRLAKDILKTTESIWDAYDEALAAAQKKEEARIISLKESAVALFVAAERMQKQRAERIAAVKKNREIIAFQLNEAKMQFEHDIHDEHQETFESSLFLLRDTEKENETITNAISAVRELPRALTDYAAVTLCFTEMREGIKDFNVVYEEGLALTQHIAALRDEASRLAKAGIPKQLLQRQAENQLAKALLKVKLANTQLKTAEEWIQSAEKKLQKFKNIFPLAMQKKPQALYDESRLLVQKASDNYEILQSGLSASREDISNIADQLKLAQKTQQEKAIERELKHLILFVIFNNPTLWKVSRWGGGVNISYDGKTMQVPRGFSSLLKKLYGEESWLDRVLGETRARDHLGKSFRYTFFHLRDPATSAFYQVLASELKTTLDEDAPERLRKAFMKIPGVTLPERKALAKINNLP